MDHYVARISPCFACEWQGHEKYAVLRSCSSSHRNAWKMLQKAMSTNFLWYKLRIPTLCRPVYNMIVTCSWSQLSVGSFSRDESVDSCRCMVLQCVFVRWWWWWCRVTSSDSVKMQRNRLRLNGASAADNGVYSCRARNAAGAIDSDPFIVNVPHGIRFPCNHESDESQFLGQNRTRKYLRFQKGVLSRSLGE